MSTAARLVKLVEGLDANGVLSAAKGGTGTTTGASVPTISAIAYGGDDTATAPAGGATITLTGTNFAAGAKVLINTTPVSVVTVVSSTQITFTAPALAAGSYILYVVNTDGSTAIAVPGIQYSGVPAWSTTAGSLGTNYEAGAVSTTVSATSDSAVTYSLYSGTLPSGVTINSSGTISGTSPLVAGSTTYTFTIRATDAEKQDTDRQFSLTVNPDVVTWSSPANGATLTGTPGVAYTSSLSAAAASGQSVSYSANALPAGLSISGSTITGTPTTAGTSSTTLTATSAVTAKTAQITINWTINVSLDTYFLYNTLLLNGENTATPFLADASTNNFALTAFGDTKPNNFGPYTPGYYSTQFNGTSDYLSIPHNANLVLPLYGGFSVECWVFMTSSTAGQYVWNKNGVSGSKHPSVALQWDGTKFRMAYGDSTGFSSVSYVNFNTIPNIVNNWVHIATQVNGSTVQSWVNGVYQPEVTIPTSPVDNGQPFYIGGQSGATSNATGLFSGYISNLRIITGGFYYDGSTAARTLPPVPTSPVQSVSINSYYFASGETQLVACNSARFMDRSSNNFTVNPVGTPKISGFTPYTPNPSYATYGSTYFDGSGDYLSIPASSALSFDADFTIECWVNTATISLDPYGRRLWSFGSGASFFLDAMFYDGSAITSNLCIQIPSIGVVIAGTIPVANNQWNHVALTRSGSSMKLFVNGVQSGSTYTNSSAFTSGASNGMFLGCLGASVGGFLLGNISNFRVVKGTAVYTANFTPPTTPLTAVAGTSLLTCQTNQPHTNSQFLDNSTSAINITRVGNATQGSFSPYGANWSNYFDGSGDYLTATGRAEIATGEFTIEAWVFPTVLNTDNAIINDNNWDIGQNGGYRLYIKGDGKLELAASTGVWNTYPVAYTSTGTVPLNKWTHIAITRNSSNVIRCFINGVQDATSVTYSTALNLSTAYALVTQIGGLIADGGLYSNFNGYISNLRVVNGTGGCLYTSTFTPPTQPLTAVAGTKLLTCQSPNITDNSLTAGAITRNGDVSVQRFSPFASVTQTPQTHSVYFGGQAVATLSPSSTNFNLTGDFTLEAWAYPTSFPGGDWGILDARTAGASASAWLFGFNGAGKIQYYDGSSRLGATAVATNSWYHVAWVRNGSALRGYVNGVLDYYNGSYGTGAISPGSTAPVIGTKDYGISAAWGTTGYISNLRVVNGTAVYTTSSTTVGATIFTPPTQPLTAVAGTVLLACQDSTLRDKSTNAYTLTPTGTVTPRRQNPFGMTTSSAQDYTTTVFGASGYFDGTGDYLDVPHSSNQWIGLNQDFTIECWFYITGGSGERVLIAKGYQGSPAYAEFGIAVNSSNQLLGIVSSSGGSWLATPTDTVAISNNTWNHVALVRSGTTITLYRNGVVAATSTSVGAALYNHTGTIRVGQHTSGSNFTGYISDARVVIGTALYTGGFVPPSAPLTVVQNTTLLLNMDRAAIVDKSGKMVLETVGDTRLSTAVKKYGSSSLYFDGTGDYLYVPSTTYLSLGTGDFTAECWVYPSSSVTADQGLLYLGGNSTYAAVRLGIATNGVYLLCSSAGNSWAVQTGVVGTITLNTWTHIAVTRSGSSFRLFVNGTQVGTTQTSSASLMSGFNYVGTYQNTSFFNFTGYMDDVRVTTGYARYTANFTPPAQALLTK